MHERGIQLTWKETRTDSWQEQTLLQKGKTGGALNIGLLGLLESPTTIVSDLLRKVKTTCQFICKTTVLPDGEKCWKTLTGSTRINWCFNLPRRTKKMTGLKQKQKKNPQKQHLAFFIVVTELKSCIANPSLTRMRYLWKYPIPSQYGIFFMR